jgi:sugar transferase EpsL
VIAAASSMPNRRRGLAAKRALDLVVALAGLVLIAPILVATALAVRIGLGRPVLFRQMRPGLGGRPFALLKFRTMTDARDAAGQPLPDERRLTPLGRWLRRTSLDELPELINVLRGDMSLVGPRPLLTDYLPHYTPEQARRHEVRPGLTGWAAVNGRNATSWEQRLAQDVWYVDHRSFALDCRILLMTVVKVIRQEGISQEGHATMPRFDEELGNKA